MPKIGERISALETKLQQLKARHAKVEARKSALASRRARKEDTRRKVLAGAVVLMRVAEGKIPKAEFRLWLEAGLTRLEDRVLFGLPLPNGSSTDADDPQR